MKIHVVVDCHLVGMAQIDRASVEGDCGRHAVVGSHKPASGHGGVTVMVPEEVPDLLAGHVHDVDGVVRPWEGFIDIGVFHWTSDDVGADAAAGFEREVALAEQ